MGGLADLAKKYARLAQPGAIASAMRGPATRVALMIERAAKENATTSPRVRSGRLRNSIAGSYDLGLEDVVISVTAGRARSGQDVVYARIIEEGGTVVPKNGKFLAIPVGPALTSAGVARFPSPRDVPDLRFQPIRGGAMGLLVKDYPGARGGRGARSEVWYVLVRSVYIRPRAYLFRARESMESRALQELSIGLHAALEAEA